MGSCNNVALENWILAVPRRQPTSEYLNLSPSLACRLGITIAFHVCPYQIDAVAAEITEATGNANVFGYGVELSDRAAIAALAESIEADGNAPDGIHILCDIFCLCVRSPWAGDGSCGRMRSPWCDADRVCADHSSTRTPGRTHTGTTTRR